MEVRDWNSQSNQGISARGPSEVPAHRGRVRLQKMERGLKKRMWGSGGISREDFGIKTQYKVQNGRFKCPECKMKPYIISNILL